MFGRLHGCEKPGALPWCWEITLVLYPEPTCSTTCSTVAAGKGRGGEVVYGKRQGEGW